MAPLARLLPVLLLVLWAALPAAFAEEALLHRIFVVPPDFASRGQSAEESGQQDAEPSTAPETAPQSRPQPYPFSIAGLSDTTTLDVRPVLASLGVRFEGRALALLGTTQDYGTLLFVRNTAEQLDLIETLCSGFGGDEGIPAEVQVTFHWEERVASGRSRTLIERTLLCRSGYRARFQRHRSNTQVEDIEIELTVGEDGSTADLNTACDLTSGTLRLTTQAMALVQDGAPEPVRLVTVAGTRPGAHSALTVQARVLARDAIPRPFAALAASIARQIADLEAGEAHPQMTAALHWFPCLGSSIPHKAERRTIPALAPMQSTEWYDAREAIRDLLVLQEGEKAWYAPRSRLLYLLAGPRTRAAAMGLASQELSPQRCQIEADFQATRTAHGRTRPLATRTLLIRSGQRAGVKRPIEGAPDEHVEAEAQVGLAGEVADCNLSLDHYPVGRDTWTFKGQCYARLSGRNEMALVSGRSADADRGQQAISLRARRVLNPWLALIRDPARNAEIIRRVEAAIGQAPGSAKAASPDAPR